MHNEITKYDDVIDSRDIIERIEELQEERDSFELEEGKDYPEGWTAAQEWDALNTDSLRDDGAADELRALLALADEASGYAPDWEYGATLIRDSYFANYAQELADDCGMLENATAWPLTCIDWAQAASELQQDYTSVEFDGVTYWIR